MRSERELLVDCLARLNRIRISYMLVGSMASNYWGVPRTTHDLDFVLVMQPDDVDRFVTAFADGFFIQPDSIRRAFDPPNQFNVIDEQSALRIDFWLLKDDLFERNAFDRRLTVDLFGSSATIATAEDVILHKLYWNKVLPSQQQLLDAAGVYVVQVGSLDIDYIRHFASILDVDRELDDLISGKLKPKNT